MLHRVAVGSWQVVPSQHEPSHVKPPLQPAAHWCVVVLQAVPARQSPATPHPHVPFDSHTAPRDEPVQTVHVPLLVPHAAVAVPCAHWLVVALQQPPLQVSEAPQLFEHTWLV